MPKIRYTSKRFGADALDMIAKANRIIEDMQSQGFDLTLRQIYYQCVAHDLFPDDRTWREVGGKWIRDPNGSKNAEPNYKWLGQILNDARLAGYVDWDAMEDRTRSLRSLATWERPEEIVRSAAYSWRIDKWETQPYRVEVWIEKDALVGIVQGVSQEHQVDYFSCRGYTSQSELWGAAQRIGSYLRGGQNVLVLHLGDHDPSGLDMSRDIEDRLRLFTETDGTHSIGEAIFDDLGNGDREQGAEVWRSLSNANQRATFDQWRESVASNWGELEVRRIALTMDQVRQFNPPPNPAKITDSRAKGYIALHGNQSWELDALNPATLVGLIRDGIESVRDEDIWADAVNREESEREILTEISSRYDDVKEYLAS